MLDFRGADDMYNGEQSALRILNHCGLTFPWIFTTPKQANLIFGILILNIFIFTYIIFIVHKYNKYKTMHYISGDFLVFWQTFYGRILTFPSFVMFALALSRVLHQCTTYNIVLLSFSLLNVLFFAINEYFSSIFLQPCMFKVTSWLDIYDTKKNMLVFLTRFLAVVLHILVFKNYSFALEIATIVVIIILNILLYYSRVIAGVHSTIVGLFMEVFPMYAFPFMLLANVHLVLPHRFRLYLLLIQAAIVLAIFHIYRSSMRKNCVSILNEFLSTSLTKHKRPFYFQYNIANVFRLAAIEVGGVEIFANLLSMRQRKSTSQLLEIIRFLGVFPSQRQKLLNVLDNLESRSNYHLFQIHLFKAILMSYLSKAPESEVSAVDALYKQYMVQSHAFWKSRINNEWKSAYKYGLNAMVTYVELSPLISSIIAHYPFDINVRLLFSEIQLTLFGDAKGAMRSKKLAMQMSQNSSVDDPLLKLMGQRYPRVTQYYADEQVSSKDTSTSPSEIEEEYSLTAMYVQKDNTFKCCGFMPNCILLFILICSFFIVCVTYEIMTDNYYKSFKKDYLSIIDTVNSITASFVMPYSIMTIYNDVPHDYTEQECTRRLERVYREIDMFFSHFEVLTPQLLELQSMIFKYINLVIVMERPKCEILGLITDYPNIYAHESSNLAMKLCSNYAAFINKAESIAERKYNIDAFIITIALSGVFMTIIVCIVTFVILNVHMKKTSIRALKILASDKILELHLRYKSMQSWDIFNEEFPIEKERSESDEEKCLPMTQVSSENFKLRNIGLKHRGSGSFIGHSFKSASQDQILKRRNSLPTESKAKESKLVCSEADKEFIKNSTKNINKKGNIYYLIGISIVFLPTIVFIATLLVLRFGVVQRSSQIERDVKVFKNNFTQFSEVLEIAIFLSNFSIEQRRDYLSWYNQTITKLEGKDSKIKIALNTKMQINPIDNLTLIEILNLFIYEKIDHRVWFIRYIQYIFDFMDNIFYVQFKNEIDAMQLPGTTNIYSFFINLVLSFGIAIYIFKYIDNLGADGYNSLFHFPNNYMDNYFKKKDLPPEHKLPSIFIQVVSSIETGFIYSISENVKEILNKNPIEFIGRKLDDMFPISKKNEGDGEMRCFQITEKIVRYFSVSQIKSEHIISTALYDESKSNTFMNLAKVRTNLATYIPQNYAKKYYEDGCLLYNYKNAYIILVRYNIDEPTQATEKVFVTANTLIQGYKALHLVWIRAGLILFICESSDIIVPILFLNDFIESCKPSPRLDSNILAISVTRNNVRAELCYFKEPYLKVTHSSYNNQLKIITKLEPKTLCIFGQLSKEVDDVFGELKEEDGINLRILPFQKISTALNSLY